MSTGEGKRLSDFDSATGFDDDDFVYMTQDLATVKGTVAQLRDAVATNATIETFTAGPNFTASILGALLTVSAFSSGAALAVGQTVFGAGVNPGQTILSLGTGTGGAGTYNLSSSQATVTSEPMGAASATQFAPGFSMSITLAGTYGAIANVGVFFDAGRQFDCTLTGQALGFNPTVPVGIQAVYAVGGSTRTIGTPSTGTVGSAQIAPASRLFFINKNTQLTPDYYGCIGDWNGTTGTDNTVNMQRLCNDVGAIGGGEIDLGNNGGFVVSNLILPDGVQIYGRGRFRSGLITTNLTGVGTANSGVFQLGAVAKLSEMFIRASGPMTNGVLVLLYGNLAEVSDYQMSNYYIGIQAGSASNLITKPKIEDGNMNSPSLTSGGSAIIGANFSQFVVKDVLGAGPASGAQPFAGLRLLNGDTAYIDSVNMTRHGAGFLANPATGQNLFSVDCVNSDFDSAIGQSSAEIAPGGGGVWGIKFATTWFGLSNQSGLLVTDSGGGTVDGVGLATCEFPGNAFCGLQVSGSNVKNVVVNGGWAAGNGIDGYQFSNGTSDFTLVGVRSGNVSGRGPNAGYGCNVLVGASNNYTIANNNLHGNGTGSLLDAGTGTAKITTPNIT